MPQKGKSTSLKSKWMNTKVTLLRVEQIFQNSSIDFFFFCKRCFIPCGKTSDRLICKTSVGFGKSIKEMCLQHISPHTDMTSSPLSGWVEKYYSISPLGISPKISLWIRRKITVLVGFWARDASQHRQHSSYFATLNFSCSIVWIVWIQCMCITLV